MSILIDFRPLPEHMMREMFTCTTALIALELVRQDVRWYNTIV